MLFKLWHLKIILYVGFLATGLGKEEFRRCTQDYCYVRSEEATRVTRDRNQRDVNDIQINRIVGIRLDREADQNYRLLEETYQGSLKRTVHPATSDVTRHLEGRSVERIETLKQFDYPERLITSDVNREQVRTIRDSNKRIGDTTRQYLNDREAIRSWNNKENAKDLNYSHENNQHPDESNLSKNSKGKEKEQLDELDTRRHNLRMEVNFVRSLEDNHEEISRRLDENQIQRDSSRTVERNYEERLKGQSSRRLVNIEYRQDTIRRMSADWYEKDITRHSEVERDENKRDWLERYEPSRILDRDVLYDVVRRLEDNAEERQFSLRRYDDRDINRRLGDILELRHIHQLLPQRQHESLEHRDGNKRDRIRFVQTLESPHIVERFPISNRELKHRRKENEQPRSERREPQSVQSRITRGFERRLQSVNERDGTKLERMEQFEDSQTRNGYNGNLKKEYEELRYTVRHREYREVEQDLRARFDNRNTLMRFDNRETSRQSRNNANLRLLDKRMSQGGGESSQHRNKNVKKRLERRYERETLYDLNRLLGGQHHETLRQFYRNEYSDIVAKERSRIEKKLGARDFRQELHDARHTERVSGQHSQRNKEFLKDLGNNKLERTITLSRHVNRNTSSFDKWLHRLERDVKFVFIHKESVNHPINRLSEENYTEKSTVFLRRIYMALGQTVVLGYIIMKTLKGKNKLTNQLPLKLGGIEEIIGF